MFSPKANRFDNPDELTRRALNQIARELLLAQSSDWAFQIYQGTTVEYSSRRFRSHIHRFSLLAEQIESGVTVSYTLLKLQTSVYIFQEIDYRIYKTTIS